MATYDLTQTTPAKLQTGDIINVPYSGTYKTITLPKGIYKLEVWGAQGGSFNTTYVGGKGGYSYGTLTLTDKETILYCYAGGKGTDGTTSGTFAGGWNGGGQAYTSSATYDMSAGGGGSDIRIGSTSLYARVIVAGGGGGAGSYSGSYRYSGGAGGGESGVAGGQYSTSYKAGLAGSQTGAGTSYYGTTANSTSYGTVASFGTGASGSTNYIAAGGGGWYGGGYARRASGGGGSGYVYTASTASNYPSGCLLTSAYYLTDATTVAGNTSFTDYSGSTVTGHSGNGCVRITVIEIKNSLKVKTKVEYTELSYIESTGTQYVDTGFKPKYNTRVVMDVSGVPASSNYLFGARGTSSSTSANQFGFYRSTATAIRSDYFGTNQSGTVSDATVRTVVDKIANVATAYGLTLTNTAVATGEVPCTLSLFGLNTSGTVEVLSTMTLHSCQIYDGDILIRDYIPALDNNNIVCLFDKVNYEFVYNAGTGSFIAGEVIGRRTVETWKDGQDYYVKTANYYTPVSYIESTGTQYVDTNFYPNQDTRVVCNLDVTPSSGETIPFGSATDGSKDYYYPDYTGGQWHYCYGTQIASTVVTTVNGLTIELNKNIITVNDASATVTAQTFTGQYPISLFAVNIGGTVGYYTTMKLYSCKIYDNDVLIRDYIPVVDNNNVACLFDKISKTFCYNSGTGNFVSGEIIGDKIEFETWKQAQEIYIKTTENLTVLDYIESDGASYIDTGFMPNQDTRMLIDYEVLDINVAEAHISSARTSGTTPLWTLYTTSALKLATRYGTGAIQTLTEPTGAGRYLFDKNKNILNIDGVQVNEVVYEIFSVTSTLTIFARNDGTAVNAYSKGRLYSYKLYDNDVLIRDYIPVLDSSGVACLYDKVTNQLFYNQGTGSFTAGYKTELPAEIELAFLESTCTQYIDTGFKPNQNTRVVMECKALSIDANGSFPFGTRTTYTSNAYAVALMPTQVFYNYGANYQFLNFTNLYEKMVIDANMTSATFIANGEVATISLSSTSFTTANNLIIGAFFEGNTVVTNNSAWRGMIYSCRVYDNNILIRDYIPKTDIQGVPALFDKVSGTYYYNQGTGTFNAGTILKRSYWKQVV